MCRRRSSRRLPPAAAWLDPLHEAAPIGGCMHACIAACSPPLCCSVHEPAALADAIACCREQGVTSSQARALPSRAGQRCSPGDLTLFHAARPALPWAWACCPEGACLLIGDACCCLAHSHWPRADSRAPAPGHLGLALACPRVLAPLLCRAAIDRALACSLAASFSGAGARVPTPSAAASVWATFRAACRLPCARLPMRALGACVH